MIINLADTEVLLSFVEEMAFNGHRFAAFNTDEVTDTYTIEFFRKTLDAQEYCLVMTNDANYFQSVAVESVIDDLKAVMESGINISENEAFDLTGFAKRFRHRKELLENNLNTNIMNQKNLEYLKDQLKYTGFGETFDAELKENMMKGDKDFKIMHTGIMNNGLPNKDTLTVELNFKKSEQTDMYFFNSYHVNLQKEESKPGLEQTFYINKDSASVTMKEAYNLMEGRSVNKDLKTKEGESYNCWLKMNFKESENGNFKLNQYHQNYGYNLEASLSKHSIKELNTPQYKEDLLNSLKKGNLQSVTFAVGGAESKMYVEANPQFKTVNVYDANLQRINHRESKEEKKAETQKESVSKDQKKNLDSEQGDSGSKDNKVKKRKTPTL
ncbi:hypothetical protein [Flavobacterium quisquiliarum]|uniref:Uncharacterized protein n=1 Tax=Flavobacterium quisquiliarum TaxID=1834436 RepID=A0ABV8W9W0_9FLAO|nr:hypothetical protein [Flavobacterium quisquiliarum]MBW1656705.1 hypothetical protein [Flavobacterium quisquiliarum]